MSARARLLESLSAPGGATPDVLADRDEEARAVRAGCCLTWWVDRSTFRIGGADRHDYLNRMVTNSVLPGAAGSGRRALLLDSKGHVGADLELLEDDGELLALAARSAVEPVLTTLRKYVLRADVRFEESDARVLAVAGPRAEAVLASVGLPPIPAAAPACARGTAGEVAVTVARCAAIPGLFELVVAPAAAPAVAAVLLDAGAVPVGSAPLELLRIEAGAPASGAELTGEQFPQEARLDPWVDFGKGCYLGQETVARIHYRGHVNRLLCGLRARAPLSPGARLSREGREAGHVTSAVESDLHGPIGLAYVRRELASAGTTLDVDGTEPPAACEVVALPFASGSGS